MKFGKNIILTGALSLILAAGSGVFKAQAVSPRYVGGDISLLPEYESAGAKYKTHEGQLIQDLLPWLRTQGMNAMRVRLFTDPSAYQGSDKDPNACQNLEYILPLCKRIVDNGFALMLDFHYSDTWADPAKQYTPAAWAGLSDEELYSKIYEYTRQTLLTLKENGIVPSFIQTGNEISYGMLWGPEGTPSSEQKKTLSGSSANWERFANLLKNAGRACREVCPDAKIILHTERVSNLGVQTGFYARMKNMKVDYDIIGLSYYPYFHGSMDVLDAALSSLESDFPDKSLMVVETGYSYKWEVPGSKFDLSSTWAYSDAGQNKFAQDLVATLEAHPNADGLFWWWMEYNAYGTQLSGWYNAPLFDSTTGRATSALKTICSFAETTGVDELSGREREDGAWYNLHGCRIPGVPGQPGLYIRDGKLIFKTI